MIIDHKKRTIEVEDFELLSKEKGYTVKNIDQNKTVFYTDIKYSGKNVKVDQAVYTSESAEEDEQKEIPELEISLRSMTPAFNYLSRFDIHDYKVLKRS